MLIFLLNLKKFEKKCETTLQNRYGCSNAYNIEKIKQKAQKNSHTLEANEKRRKHEKQTKHEKMLDSTYLENIITKTKETNQQRYGADWVQLTVDGKEKIRKSVCILFKTDPTYKQRLKAKYMYNDLSFDSSYELAYYIYAIDHNEQIVRCPCKFNYTKQNGKMGIYIPDFSHNGQLIEIKGDCFFDKDGHLFNFYDNTSLQEKYDCMVKHNVKILRKQDIVQQINYCKQKFQSGIRWYRQFQTKKI